MNLQELIDFHTVGAESCEAYAVTPDADAAKNKDIAKHYNKRAKWHRDAIALVQGLSAGAERYQWLRDKSEPLHSFYLSVPIWMTGVKFNKETVDSTIDALRIDEAPGHEN